MRVGSLVAVLLTIATPVGVLAQGAEAPAAGHYTTADTDVGTLLDDPASKAVLDKNIPGFSANPQIQMARSMTLRQLQQFDSAALPDKLLASVDADLAALPAKK
jgi:hypothetical protein